jgi:hypothetical protein
MHNTPNLAYGSPLSKRAARRLIQRAFVLTGRDKHVRQHIREAHLTSLWILQDCNLAWSVVLDRGKVEFDRRPTRKPDVTLTWKTADEFFTQVENDIATQSPVEAEEGVGLRRLCEPLLAGFRASLRKVLRNPVDDDGESLL